MRPTLEEYALTLAEAAAVRSEDPHRKVGAVILGHHGEVLSVGYNGPPAGIDIIDWDDREFIRLMTIHAEANALRYVRPGEGALLASTYLPCIECLKATRAQGIIDVVYWMKSSERWSMASLAIAPYLGLELKQVE